MSQPHVQESERGHLPDCKLITFREVRQEMGDPAPAGDPWYDQAGIEACSMGCPHREASVAHARAFARNKGWQKANPKGEQR